MFEEFSIIKVEFPIRFNNTMDDVRPKVTKSERESSWIPRDDSTFKSLAKNPSKKSQINPTETKIAKISRSPIIPNTTAIQPTKRFVSVKKFGKNFNKFTILN